MLRFPSSSPAFPSCPPPRPRLPNILPGLPVICNTGVGDLDEIIEADRIGVLIREFSLQAYQEAQEALLEMLRDDSVSDRCRGAARRRFDLKDVGGPRYQRLYRRLFQAEDRRLVPSEALP